jgi:hypothetical protein
LTATITRTTTVICISKTGCKTFLAIVQRFQGPLLSPLSYGQQFKFYFHNPCSTQCNMRIQNLRELGGD